MGMAHRGRLNVLAHVLGRPYRRSSPSSRATWPSSGRRGDARAAGDVKYHLGAERHLRHAQRAAGDGDAGSPNPSHLER